MAVPTPPDDGVHGTIFQRQSRYEFNVRKADGSDPVTDKNQIERSQLDANGYCIVQQAIGHDQVAVLRSTVECLANEQETDTSSGTRHIDICVARHTDIEQLIGNERVSALVESVLGSSHRIQKIGCRDPLPGYGSQRLHTDWMPLIAPGQFFAATVLWALDDFTSDNGSTRVVPQTHKRTGAIPKSIRNSDADHAQQEIVVCAAGDAIVLNGHVWHGGTKNCSDSSRRAIQIQYVAQ